MEAKLTELVSRLKAAAEANLKSVVLYGSAVTAEFRAGHSDLNVLCIVDRVAAEDLEHLHDAVGVVGAPGQSASSTLHAR